LGCASERICAAGALSLSGARSVPLRSSIRMTCDMMFSVVYKYSV
jgi:hypothetical protein